MIVYAKVYERSEFDLQVEVDDNATDEEIDDALEDAWCDDLCSRVDWNWDIHRVG